MFVWSPVCSASRDAMSSPQCRNVTQYMSKGVTQPMHRKLNTIVCIAQFDRLTITQNANYNTKASSLKPKITTMSFSILYKYSNLYSFPINDWLLLQFCINIPFIWLLFRLEIHSDFQNNWYRLSLQKPITMWACILFWFS